MKKLYESNTKAVNLTQGCMGLKTYNAIFLKLNKRNNEEVQSTKSSTKVHNLGVGKTRGYRPDNKN